jgi:hypothetical protein
MPSRIITTRTGARVIFPKSGGRIYHQSAGTRERIAAIKREFERQRIVPTSIRVEKHQKYLELRRYLSLGVTADSESICEMEVYSCPKADNLIEAIVKENKWNVSDGFLELEFKK